MEKIFEGNLNTILDGVLLIKTDQLLRRNRAVKRKNISLLEIEKRMALQMDDDKKEKLANFIIDNN